MGTGRENLAKFLTLAPIIPNLASPQATSLPHKPVQPLKQSKEAFYNLHTLTLMNREAFTPLTPYRPLQRLKGAMRIVLGKDT